MSYGTKQRVIFAGLIAGFMVVFNAINDDSPEQTPPPRPTLKTTAAPPADKPIGSAEPANADPTGASGDDTPTPDDETRPRAVSPQQGYIDGVDTPDAATEPEAPAEKESPEGQEAPAASWPPDNFKPQPTWRPFTWQAYTKAKEAGEPILIYFTGGAECPACIRFDATVLDEAAEELSDGFLLLRDESFGRSPFARAFRIRVCPTVCLVRHDKFARFHSFRGQATAVDLELPWDREEFITAMSMYAFRFDHLTRQEQSQ